MASVNRIDATFNGGAEPPLVAWLSMLAPKGVLNLSASDDRVEELKMALVLGGFVDITTEAAAGGTTVLSASKPAWELGAAAKLNKPMTHVVLPTGDDDDMVDEDALLGDLPDAPASTSGTAGGCATKKRACKDCSCGRAELEAKGDAESMAAAATLAAAPKSACGNCSKGDAFRCAGCPYLGKPAFEAGQENVILNLDQNDAEMASEASFQNGVKLNLDTDDF